MEHVTGIEWLNGTSNEHNTPLSATNLNSINKGTETALNAIIDDVANNVATINENMENKNYIKKYNGDSVVSSVVCGDNDVTVTGKDLKVDNNIELNQGKSVFTDYLSSKNNQNGAVNGTVSNALTANVANKLAISVAGSTNQPVYFNNGIPLAITGYTVRKEIYNTLGDFYTALKNGTAPFTPEKIIFVDMDISLSKNYITKGNIFYGTASQSSGSVIPVTWEYHTDASGYLLSSLKDRFIYVDHTSSDFTFEKLSNVTLDCTQTLRLYPNNIVFQEDSHEINASTTHGNPYCNIGRTSISIQDERSRAGTIAVVYYNND